MTIARAVRIKEPGGPEVLHIDRIPVDDPGPSELLVEVAAAGLNRADLLQRRGNYPAPPGVPSDVPGLEFAGKVAAVGSRVTLFAPGDRVMGIVPGAAMATHLTLHEREAMPVPDGLALSHAAAIPEAFLTAFDAIFAQAELKAGETVLVHAVGSGVGTAALQLARRAGARVIGTSRTEAKLERCAELGLSEGVLVKDGKFADRVRELTGDGVQVVLDMIGGAYLEENLKSLALRGRMIVIGLMGGRAAELPMGTMLRRRLSVTGSVLRSRPLEEKATLVQRFAREALGGFGEDGPLAPIVDDVMPMAEIQAAHERMESNATFGKIVLEWSS